MSTCSQMLPCKRAIYCLLLLTVTVSLIRSEAAWGQAHEPAPADEALASEAPAEPAVVAGYEKGFFIRSGDGLFELRTKAGIQAQFAVESLDSAGGRETEAAFLIRRGRLIFEGHAFDPNLTFKLQAGFDRGSVGLRDFYVDYAFVPGWLRLRAGQWKRPFSRQFLNSGLGQEFVDRAITHNFFNTGRDVGVAIHNGSPSGFEYALGVFNGTGDSPRLSGDVVLDPSTGEGDITSGRFTNVPDVLHPAVVMRLGYNYGGIKGYSEADLEGGPLRFAVGASALLDLDADGDDASGVQAELDYALKVHGFSTTGAVYVSAAQSGSGFGDQSFDAIGFHLQVGYVIAERFQPVFRYALVAPDGSDNDLQEIALGFSSYFFGHNFKWQTDAALLSEQDPSGDRNNYRLRSQLQFSF